MRVRVSIFCSPYRHSSSNTLQELDAQQSLRSLQPQQSVKAQIKQTPPRSAQCAYFIHTNKLKVGAIGVMRGHFTRNQLKEHEEWAKFEEFMYTKIKLNVGRGIKGRHERTEDQKSIAVILCLFHWLKYVHN